MKLHMNTLGIDIGSTTVKIALLNKDGEELYRALQIYTVGSIVLDSMNDSNADLLTRTILQNPVVKKKLKKAMRSRNDLERSESF